MRYARPTVLLASFAVLVAVGTAHAQQTPPRTTVFKLPAAPDAAALQRGDLGWVRTGNDFDQRSMDAAAIDREIGRRLALYDRETAVVSFDVPINSKRLVAPARRLYRSFDARLSALNAQPLNQEMYFWRYGDVDVAVPGNTLQDQLNVYAVARAMEVLRHRYPIAYQRAFVDTRAFSSTPPTPGTFVNRFDRVLVAFHTATSAATAESGSALGPNEDLSGPYGKYSNLAVISVNATNILGQPTAGSRALYQSADDEENYLRYLREGIVETLVHEMLHRAIDTRTNIDPVATMIFQARPTGTTSARPLNNLWEEAFIINTTLPYFVRAGGIQAPLFYYYRGILDGNVAALYALRLASITDDMGRVPGFTGSNHLEVMRLPWLN